LMPSSAGAGGRRRHDMGCRCRQSCRYRDDDPSAELAATDPTRSRLDIRESWGLGAIAKIRELARRGARPRSCAKVHNFEGHMGGYVAALRRKPDLCMWDGSVFQGIKPLLADHN
jgi:hypothetical protein